MNDKGILRCARYAFMPNHLSFCGPDKNRDLFEYCQENHRDRGLDIILKEFQTLYPYLKFIAQSNNIKDVFDQKVVEAYWIGNNLLENIEKSKIYTHLLDNLNLKKKLNQKKISTLSQSIRSGFKPHHSFHVLGAWKQGQFLDSMQTLASMDLCRISWGKVEKVNRADLAVKYRPLIFEKNKLKLGQPVGQKVNFKLNDQSFIRDIKIGNWVSFHWGFACEVLNESEVKNLEKYTEEGIDLVNLCKKNLKRYQLKTR